MLHIPKCIFSSCDFLMWPSFYNFFLLLLLSSAKSCFKHFIYKIKYTEKEICNNHGQVQKLNFPSKLNSPQLSLLNHNNFSPVQEVNIILTFIAVICVFLCRFIYVIINNIFEFCLILNFLYRESYFMYSFVLWFFCFLLNVMIVRII